MPKTDRVSGTSRRTLLASAALVAPVSLLLAIAAAAEQKPDPHLAWWAEIEALDARDGVVTGRTDEEIEAETDPMCALEDLIGSTPSRTLAGAAV